MAKISRVKGFRSFYRNQLFLEEIEISFFHRNHFVSSGASLTSWGEGASSALVDHPSSDGVTIKMPSVVDFLHQPASHPIFSYWVS